MSAITLQKEQYHSMVMEKPKMSSSELVQKMTEKGITFSNCDIKDAETYLIDSNNFLRLYSYRKNYQKHTDGENKGKYVNLDFKHLKSLAILDMQIRKSLFGICVDIEHSLKLRILNDVENIEDDGYTLVRNFFYDSTYNGDKVAKSIFSKRNSEYISGLLRKYIRCVDDLINVENLYEIEWDNHRYVIDMPVWVFLETITFGDLIHFYNYFYNSLPEGLALNRPIDKSILMAVKSIRNACAHNNCILNDLIKYETHPSNKIKTFIGKLDVKDVGKKLECRALSEIICVLYSIDKLGSDRIKVHDIKDFNETLVHFEQKHLDEFVNNKTITTSFMFLKNTVDKLMKRWYHI